MKGLMSVLVTGVVVFGVVSSPKLSAEPLASQNYNILYEHFNNDANLDMFYQAKSGHNFHGVIHGDQEGQFSNKVQEWENEYLGVNWSEDNFKMHALQADNQNGADIFIQSKSSNQNSFIAYTGPYGKISNLSSAIPDNYLGYTWNSRSTNLVPLRNINSYGGTDYSVFLQGQRSDSQHAVIAFDDSGYPATVKQTWASDYLGLEWDGLTHIVHAADFNGDGNTDFLLQPKYKFILIPDGSGLITPIATLPETGVSIVLSEADGSYTTVHKSFSADYLGINWIADHTQLHVGDFNGDGKSDILLQGRSTTSKHYLLHNDGTGNFSAITQSWDNGHLGKDWSSALSKVSVIDTDNDGRADIILQGANVIEAITSDASGLISQSSLINNLVPGYIKVGRTVHKTGTTVVGTVPASFDVNMSGVATYSIPIEVPPGIAGMQPSVSLEYSSGAGNGIAGMGWSLSGMSAVHRCAKTYAQDGVYGSVNYDADDRLCLDGKRLIVINNLPYGSNGAQYRTEVDEFTRVTGHGDFNSPGAFFVAETKSGQVYYYGKKSDSKYTLASTGDVASWSVSNIFDTKGNYINYHYINEPSTGFFILDKLTYTHKSTDLLVSIKNGNAVTVNEIPLGQVSRVIKFEYDDRADTNFYYNKGNKGYSTHRLMAVNTYVGNDGDKNPDNLVKNYQLHYEDDSLLEFSRISKIRVCSKQSTCLSETAFNWDTSVANNFSSVHSVAGLEGVRINVNPNTNSDGGILGAVLEAIGSVLSEVADFNGDGLSDVIFLHPEGAHSLALSNGSGGFTYTKTIGNITGNKFKKDETQSLVVDYNGDGISDVLVVQDNGNHWVAQSNGDGTFAYIGHVGGLEQGTLYNSRLLTGDFDGNGSTDVMRFNKDGDHFLSLGSGKSTFYPNNTVVGLEGTGFWEDGAQFVTGDFNGDGLTDIFHIMKSESGGWLEATYYKIYSNWIAFSNGDGSFTPKTNIPGLNGARYWKNNSFMFAGDFNGDGYEDIIRLQKDGNHWLAFSKGDDTFEMVGNVPGLEGVTYWKDAATLNVADFNGDGYDDVLRLQKDGNHYVAFSDRNGGFVINHTVNGIEGSGYANKEQVILPGDYNGDGKLDILKLQEDGNQWLALNNSNTSSKVTKITDGYDNETNINYGFLSDSNIYSTDTRCEYPETRYPESCLTTPMQVVSKYTASNGVGGLAEYNYSYKNLKINFRGRGLLGFGEVTKTDVTQDIKVITTLDNTYNYSTSDTNMIDYPFLGVPTEKLTYIGGVLTNEVTYRYDIKWTEGSNLAGFTYTAPHYPFVWVSEEKKYDPLYGELISTTSTWNEYGWEQPSAGNLTYSRVKVTDNRSGIYQTKKVRNEYLEDDISNWKLGRLTSSTVTHTTNMTNSSGQIVPDQVRKSIFSYYPDGLLKTSVEEPENPDLYLKTTYSYDEYGNKNSVTVEGSPLAVYPVAARTTTTGYVPGTINSMTPQVVTTNALGHSETKTLDARFGVVKHLQGPNELPTSWEYDDFGRKITETRADGNQTIIDYLLCTALTCPTDLNGKAVYAITQSTEGSQPVSVYYDQLERKIRTESLDINNNVINKDTVYNAKGQLDKVSDNYYAGLTPAWNTFKYDAANRPIEETQTSGTIKEIQRNGFYTYTYVTKVSGIDGTQERRLTSLTHTYTNGKKSAAMDSTYNSVVYYYDAIGNLTETKSNGVSTKMAYDNRGRKIWMDDSDMGAWEYKHDALGNLRWQKDANGNETLITYDLLNRKVLRLEDEGASVWHYDSAAMGKGKLAWVKGPISLTQAQNDALWANPSVSNALSYANSSTYSQWYVYDAYGRPAIKTTNIDGNSYVMSTNYDLLGRVTKVTYPTNVRGERFGIENIYDSNSYLRQVQSANIDPITQQKYVFWRLGDANGNVNAASNVNGQTTQYTYGNGTTTDKVYDLATGLVKSIASGNGRVQNLGYVFDSIGNLQKRTDNAQVILGQALTETFTYDELNRLTFVHLNGTQSKEMRYEANGNIKYNSGFGTYYYDGTSGPHAVDRVVDNSGVVLASYQYDANGNMLSGDGRGIAYTSFNKPRHISKGTTNVQFLYDANHQRYKKTKNFTDTTYYINKPADAGASFEREVKSGVTVADVHYIYAGGEMIGKHTVKNTNERSTRYFHKDHLGSIDVITDEFGNVRERLSFSAFGARRNSNWEVAQSAIEAFETNRGFTGHEHLDSIGLIHMNGRVYDPKLARFLSADPIVQAPSFTQSYNRYSYVMNNPLSLTDPSGYSWLSDGLRKLGRSVKKRLKKVTRFLKKYGRQLAGLAITAFGPPGFWTGFASGYVASGGDLRSALAGGISAEIFIGIGDSKELTGMTKVFAHGVAGGVMQEAMGGEFRHGFYSAFVTQYASQSKWFSGIESDLGNTFAAATLGGVTSVLGGGKFMNGAITGAFSRMFNDLAHDEHNLSPGDNPNEIYDEVIEAEAIELHKKLDGLCATVSLSQCSIGEHGIIKSNVLTVEQAHAINIGKSEDFIMIKGIGATISKSPIPLVKWTGRGITAAGKTAEHMYIDVMPGDVIIHGYAEIKFSGGSLFHSQKVIVGGR